MNAPDFRNEILDMGQTLKACMEKIVEPIVSTVGLTSLQTMILVGIKKNEISNVSSVCKETGIGQANASTICKKMERDGFITRVRDKNDERIVSLFITQKGLDSLEFLKEKCDAFSPALESVPDEKLEDILKGFKAMREVLEILLDKKIKEN